MGVSQAQTHHFYPLISKHVVCVAVDVSNRGSGNEQRELASMVLLRSLSGLTIVLLRKKLCKGWETSVHVE
jgi:hypothetical protein